MSWRGVALVLALLIAGCASPVPEPTADPATSTVFRSTAMVGCENAQSTRCNESTIAIDSTGRLFVANGFGTALAVSSDRGETWQQLAGPTRPVTGPNMRDTDSLVRVTRDDQVVFSALVGQYGASGTVLLMGLHVAVSSDAGQTWPVNRLITLDDRHQTLGADRQWTTDGPDGALYIAYSHFFSDPLVGAVRFNGESVNTALLNGYVGNLIEVARSDDGGATWGPFVQVSPLGDGTFAGGIVATGDGDLVVPTRSGPADRSTVALTLFRSTDRGTTWTSEIVTGPAPAGEGIEPWPSFAAKADGSEALAWTEKGQLMVSVRNSPQENWPPPTAWSLAEEDVRETPAVLGTAAGWAVSYVPGRGEAPDRVGDFVLVEGVAEGPRKHTVLAADVPILIRGANSDFATLASGPNGSLAVTVTLVDPSAAIDVYVVRPQDAELA